MIQPAFEILNQRGTPMFFSDVFSNRPTAGIIGRIFISTDTKEFYRDTGSTWELIGGPGSGTVTGSGAAGQVAFWNAASTISGSNNLWWDNSSSKFLVGTNNTAGAGALQVTSATGDDQLRVWGATSPSIRIDNSVTGATQRFVMGLATATNNFIQGSAAGNICISSASASPILFGMWQTINASEVMRISTANNLLLGTSVDGGQRFQVSGDTFLKGSVNTNASNSLTIQNSDGNPAFSVRNDRYTTIFGLSTPQTILTDSLGSITLNTNTFPFNLIGGIGNNTNGALTITSTNINSNYGGTKTLFDITASWTTSNAVSGILNGIRYSPTINQTGSALGITRGLYINPTLTSAADWRSIEWSNNSGYGLWGVGTAPNYINGNLLVGTNTNTGEKLRVNGNSLIIGSSNTSFSNALTVQNSDLTNIFRVRNDGQIFLAGQLNMGNGTLSYSTNPSDQFTILGNQGINLNHVNGNAGQIVLGSSGSANFSVSISGSRTGVEIARPVTPLTGSTGFIFNALGIVNSINFTNATSSFARGIFISPGLVNVTDFRAIESASGGAYFNTSSVEASAILQADSTTKGFLPPRMTTTQINAIATPAEGLVVYNTTLSHLCCYQAGAWVKFSHTPM